MSLKKSIVVRWKNYSGKNSGSQLKRMSGAAESGCCRQSGSPCSAKKYSS